MSKTKKMKGNVLAVIIGCTALLFGYFSLFQNPMIADSKDVNLDMLTNNQDGQRFAEGQKLIQEKKYPEAMQLYKEMIMKDDNNPVLYTNLAYICEMQQQYDQAMEYIKKALTLDKGNYMAYKLQGDCEFKQNKGDEAIESYKKAIGLNPQKNAFCYPELISILWIRKQQEECLKYIQQFEEILSKQPELAKQPINILAYQSEVEIYYSKKEYRLALESCNKILSIDSQNVFAAKSKPIIEKMINH